MEGRGRRLGHAASWRKERAASAVSNGTPAVEATPMEEETPGTQPEIEPDSLIRRCEEFIRDQDNETGDPVRQLIRATVSVIEDHAPRIITNSTKQLQDELQALKAEMDTVSKQRQEDKAEIERLQVELKNVKEEHSKEQRRLKEVLTTFLHEG